MRKALLPFIFILVLLANGAIAQRRFPPRPPRPGMHHAFAHRDRLHRTSHAIKSYPNVLTGKIGLGVVGKIFGASFGGEYERYLDKDAHFSVAIPVIVYIGGFINFDSYGSGDTRSGNHGVYTAPGFKFHPLGNRKTLDPGLGLALAVGSNIRNDLYLGYNGRETRTEYHDPLVALLGEVILNIRPGSGFVFGVFISGGPMLTGGIPGGAMLQIGMKLGSGF